MKVRNANMCSRCHPQLFEDSLTIVVEMETSTQAVHMPRTWWSQEDTDNFLGCGAVAKRKGLSVKILPEFCCWFHAWWPVMSACQSFQKSHCACIYDIWDWIETVGKFWIEEQSLISLVEFFLAWTSFHLSPWIVWTAVAQLYWIGNEKTERKLWKDGGEEILYNLFIYCVSNHSFIYSVKHNQINLIKLLLDGANYGVGISNLLGKNDMRSSLHG